MGWLSNLANATPGLGPLKGLYHYARGEEEEGDEAMYQSTRTTAVIAGGIFGGPMVASAAGLATDTVASALMKKEKGLINSFKNIGDDIEANRNPLGSIASAGLQLGLDGISGYGGGSSSGAASNAAKGAAGKTMQKGGEQVILKSARISSAEASKWIARKTVERTAITTAERAILMSSHIGFTAAQRNELEERERREWEERERRRERERGEREWRKRVREARKSSERERREKEEQTARAWRNLLVEIEIESREEEQRQRELEQQMWREHERGQREWRERMEREQRGREWRDQEQRRREQQRKSEEQKKLKEQEECKKKEQRANSEKQKRDTSGSNSGSSQPPQGNKDNNQKRNEKNEKKKVFFENFIKLLKRILKNVYGNESEPFSTIFENLSKKDKEYLIKVLEPIMKFGTLDAVIELVIRLFKQHFPGDISYGVFLSLLEFVQAYIADELLKRTRISRGTVTAETKMKPDERREKIISDIVNEKDIVDKLNNLFKGIKTEIEAENANFKFPNFRDMFAAVYHYIKHRRLPVDGTILSVVEYYEWVKKFLVEMVKTPKYAELKAGKIQNYIHEPLVPEFCRRFRIVLRRRDNNIVLSSAFVVDKMHPDDQKHIISTVTEVFTTIFMAICLFYILKQVFFWAIIILLNTPSMVFTCIAFIMNMILNTLLFFFACLIFILKVLLNILLIYLCVWLLLSSFPPAR